MKRTSVALLVLGSAVTLTLSLPAESRQAIRADLPYPFGGGGPPDSTAWSLLSGGPFEPIGNTGLATGVAPFEYTLASGSNIQYDQDGLPVLPYYSLQNAYYAAAVPTAADTDGSLTAPTPLAQVLYYALDSSSGLLPAGVSGGSIEIQFNYDSPPFLNVGSVGQASLTFGGATYTSNGSPQTFENNFVFSSTGAYLGSFVEDMTTNIVTLSGSNSAGNAPAGWTSSATSTPPTSAPEIDPSSATAALTLLAGGLAMLFSGRRSLKAVR